VNHRRGGEFPWQEGPRYAHDSWWYGPLHLVFFLLLIALLVVGIVWLLRRLQLGSAVQPASSTGPTATTPAVDPAVAALRLRYAQGDVSRDDYLQGIEDLIGAGRWPAEHDQGDTEQTGS
jgi:uncharacterized membrane protein